MSSRDEVRELQARVERVRTQSKLSAEYWRLRTAEGEPKLAYFCPPGDLARVRKHYPGANGDPIDKAEWMTAVDNPETWAHD